MKNYIVEIIVGSVFLICFVTLFFMLCFGIALPIQLQTMFDTMLGILVGYLSHSSLSKKRSEIRESEKKTKELDK
ncbi:MAG: hypothetical protein ACK5LT_12315 [Lachnospirales bacterium]